MREELETVVFYSDLNNDARPHFSQKKVTAMLLEKYSTELSTFPQAKEELEKEMRNELSRQCGFVAPNRGFDELNKKLETICELVYEQLRFLPWSQKIDKLKEVLAYGKKQCLAFINAVPQTNFIDRQLAKEYVEDKLKVMKQLFEDPYIAERECFGRDSWKDRISSLEWK